MPSLIHNLPDNERGSAVVAFLHPELQGAGSLQKGMVRNGRRAQHAVKRQRIWRRDALDFYALSPFGNPPYIVKSPRPPFRHILPPPAAQVVPAHQKGAFYGRLEDVFEQLHGKEISYNNLLDIDAAVSLISDFDETTFAILKHNNACGIASRNTLLEAWKDALAGDPVSAFGGVLVTNRPVDRATAEEITKIFFEVIIAPDYDMDALEVLTQKKNRIILILKDYELSKKTFRSVLNGVLVQDRDLSVETLEDFKYVTSKQPTAAEAEDLIFANKVVKHSKSNSIVLAKNKQLCASGVGRTSRVDALKQAIEKAGSFNMDLHGAVMASDAFFPFPDCVEIADKAGITAVIQPGGSIRDNETVEYCEKHGVAMVTTGVRHFKH